METIKLKEVSRWLRFIHFVVDHALVALVTYFLLGYLYSQGIVRVEDEHIKYYYAGLLFIYYLVMETTTHRTVGKLLTSSKVVSADFKKPSIGKMLLRTLVRFVPFEVLSGFAYPWHDTWTDTKVVRA